MVRGTKLFLKRACFQFRDLYLRPDGNREKSGLSGVIGYSGCSVGALFLRSDKYMQNLHFKCRNLINEI